MNQFETIAREKNGVTPSPGKTTVPDLHELIRPHLDSFNAIRSLNNNRSKGLLDVAIADLDKRDMKDSFGNKLECTSTESST